ncbi:MAG: glutamate--cysteine ligase [Gemmatimonadaceae bacterium]
MARPIDRTTFEDAEYDAFGVRLESNLRALRGLLSRPGFGEGDVSLGAELEMSIVDRHARALGVNREVLARSNDPRLALELDHFNLEYNLTPVCARGHPFARLEAEAASALNETNRLAGPLGGRIVPIGILPTLTEEDLEIGALTDEPRYHALSEGVRRLRHAPSLVRIQGDDSIALSSSDVTLEGANTSFQVHYRVTPRNFASSYNAAQLAIPLALAVSSNSPTFLGRRLWEETRIALFKQSLDYRDFDPTRWRPPTRVGFGHGWVREGAWELFAESAGLFAPLFPICDNEDAEETVADGGIPRLSELRLHQGTVWRWNRAVYDPDFGGHLRIEMRALPSGPTPVDMVASAAFLVGLTRALSDRVDEMLPHFPFAYAEYNFYRAAQQGINATLLWPGMRSGASSPVEVAATHAVLTALPLAAEGLALLGVASDESDRLLDIVRDRVLSGTTPSRWQRRVLDRLLLTHDRADALALLVEQYLTQAQTGRPVHEWSDA